jgi:hypothetical protein
MQGSGDVIDYLSYPTLVQARVRRGAADGPAVRGAHWAGTAWSVACTRREDSNGLGT